MTGPPTPSGACDWPGSSTSGGPFAARAALRATASSSSSAIPNAASTRTKATRGLVIASPQGDGRSRVGLAPVLAAGELNPPARHHLLGGAVAGQGERYSVRRVGVQATGGRGRVVGEPRVARATLAVVGLLRHVQRGPVRSGVGPRDPRAAGRDVVGHVVPRATVTHDRLIIGGAGVTGLVVDHARRERHRPGQRWSSTGAGQAVPALAPPVHRVRAALARGEHRVSHQRVPHVPPPVAALTRFTEASPTFSTRVGPRLPGRTMTITRATIKTSMSQSNTRCIDLPFLGC